MREKTENEYYQQIIKIQNEIKFKCKNFDFKNFKFKKIENTLYLDNNSLITNLQKLNFPNITIEIQYNIFLIWNFILSIISNYGKDKFKESKFYNINQQFSNILLTIDGLILPKIINLNFQNIKINNNLSIKNIFNISWAKTSFKKDNIQLKIEIKPSEFYNYIFTIKYNNLQSSFTLINLYQYICFYNYLIKQFHLLYLDITEIHIFNNIFKLIQKHSDSLTNSDLTWKLSILQKESNKMSTNNINNYNKNEIFNIINDILSCINQRVTNIITNNFLNNYKNTFPILSLDNIQYKLQNNEKIIFSQKNSIHEKLELYYKSGLGQIEDITLSNDCNPISTYINIAKKIDLLNLILENDNLIITIKNKKLSEFIIDTELLKLPETELYFNDAYEIYKTKAQKYNFQKEKNTNNLNPILVNEFIKEYTNIQNKNNKINYTSDIKEIIEQNKNINLTLQEIVQKLKYKYNFQNYNIFKVYILIKNIILINKNFLCQKLTQNLLQDRHFYIKNLNNLKFKLEDDTEINYLYQLQNIQTFNNLFQHDYILEFNDYESIFLGYEETINYNQYMPIQKYIEQTNKTGLAKLQIINNELIVTIKNKLLYDFIKNDQLKSCIESKLHFNEAYKIYDMIIQVDNYFNSKQINKNNNQTQQFIQNYLKESFKIPTDEQKEHDFIKQVFNKYNDFKYIVNEKIFMSQIKTQYNIYNTEYIENELYKIYNSNFENLDQMIKNRVTNYDIINNETLSSFLTKCNKAEFYNIILQTLLNIKFIIKNEIFKITHINYNIEFLFNNQLILNNGLDKLEKINNLYIEQFTITKITELINKTIDNNQYIINEFQFNDNKTICINLQYEDLINIPIDVINIENNTKFNFNLLILDYISSFLYYCGHQK